MITLWVDLELPEWLGGGREQVQMVLHSGYGPDPAVAHEILGVTLTTGDDVWVRVFDLDEEMWIIPREWVRGWSTTQDGGSGAVCSD